MDKLYFNGPLCEIVLSDDESVQLTIHVWI